eukprot:SAG31_NODE_642_length_13301_cov_14.143084_1_plen_51_part_10
MGGIANSWNFTTHKAFNENGWKCTKMRYDPCLFKIVAPEGGILFLVVHVDD